MSQEFIKLYDESGYEYIVNMDKITCVNVADKRVWAEGKTTLDICDKSIDYLRSRLVGDGK